MRRCIHQDRDRLARLRIIEAKHGKRRIDGTAGNRILISIDAAQHRDRPVGTDQPPVIANHGSTVAEPDLHGMRVRAGIAHGRDYAIDHGSFPHRQFAARPIVQEKWAGVGVCRGEENVPNIRI